MEQANLANQQAKAVPTQAELNRANAANASASAKQTEMVNTFNVENPNIFRTGQAHKAMPSVSPGGTAAVINQGLDDLSKAGRSVIKWIGGKINPKSVPNNGTSSPTLTNSKMFTDYNDY